MTRHIILNKMITPDGTVLISRHVHDMVSHTDSITGEEYITDGGTEYLRRSTNEIPAIDATVYDDDPFEIIREHFQWGTRGPIGNLPLKYVTLKDMTADHIRAILETQTHIRPHIKHLFVMELVHRGISGEKGNSK